MVLATATAAAGTAGIASRITINDILTMMFITLLGLSVFHGLTSPGMSFFDVYSYKVVGYPECRSFFCLGPSQQSVSTLVATFSGKFTQGAGIGDYILLLLSGADVVKGMLGMFVVIVGSVKAIESVYRYYDWMGVWR